jgi:hypothetical protein
MWQFSWQSFQTSYFFHFLDIVDVPRAKPVIDAAMSNIAHPESSSDYVILVIVFCLLLCIVIPIVAKILECKNDKCNSQPIN